MRFSRWSRVRRNVASVIVIAILVATGITVAALNRGFPVSSVQLDPRIVWITKGALAGRLNDQIGELTASLESTSTHPQVLQNKYGVYFYSASAVQRIDPTLVNPPQHTAIPKGATVAVGRTTMAVLSPQGNLWVVNVANSLAYTMSSKPLLRLGTGARVAVGDDGIAYVASRAKLYVISAGGTVVSSRAIRMSPSFQLSVVGDTPVLLSGDTLTTGSGTTVAVPSSSSDEMLQQPGASAPYALVETNRALVRLPLGGGNALVRRSGTLGVPIAPVHLDGCDYSAWASTRADFPFLRLCDGRPSYSHNLVGLGKISELAFRVNDHVVALNDLQYGSAWTLTGVPTRVNDWGQVSPPKQQKVAQGSQKKAVVPIEAAAAHQSVPDRAPTAHPDSYDIRAGQTEILPVLNNDTDPDGDVLSIAALPTVPASFGTMHLIDGGRALQFKALGAVGASASFGYTADDGRGGSDSTSDEIQIISASSNQPPRADFTASVNVELGQSVSENVLADWTDPDGDDLTLVSAHSVTSDVVSTTPDGYLTFQSKSGQLGQTTVSYSVSDGNSGGTATGNLVVNVKPAGSLAPVATPDFATVEQGRTAVIRPLANDQSLSGAPLRLVTAAENTAAEKMVGGLEPTINPDQGLVAVPTYSAGTFYLTYTVDAGPEQSTGIIRLDVTPAPSSTAAQPPPIAVKDTAYIRPSQTIVVPVLDNDVSPTGKILSVQSIDVAGTNPAITVELLNNTEVRVTESSAVLVGSTSFGYTVTDGSRADSGGVVKLLPAPPLVVHVPPIAVDDVQTVRAGSAATVDVLANDYHPDQQQIILDPRLVEEPDAGGGFAFVSGDTVKYQAPAKPGEWTAQYRISDKFGQSATATVTFNVVDPKSDTAPSPLPETARTFVGQAIQICPALNGVDPDGDPVTLDGIAESPTMGTIETKGSTPTCLEYLAGSQTGTDTFEYQVEDPDGLVGTAQIKVGIIARPSSASKPDAVEDTVEVRPGSSVSVAVLANDSDPNGYALALEPKLADVSPGWHPSVTGQDLVAKAPLKVGLYTVRYSVSNGHGGVGSALVSVEVKADAPLQVPVAPDYYIASSLVHGTKPITLGSAQLPFSNPNGAKSALILSTVGADGKPSGGGGRSITVVPQQKITAITYRVTDPTNPSLWADGFIVVPGKRAAETPQLRSDLKLDPVVKPITYPLSELVFAPSGTPVRVEAASTLRVDPASAGTLHDGGSSITFKPTAKSVAADLTFGVEDADGNKALLTMPITIGAATAKPQAPAFTTQQVNVQEGESPIQLNLRQYVSDSDPKVVPELNFSNAEPGAPNSAFITPTISGSNLTIGASDTTTVGATETITFTISGVGDVPSAKGTVMATVVSSTKPEATVESQSTTVTRGQDASTNVIAGHTTNPFPAKPLTLASAPTPAQGSSADPDAKVVSWDPDGSIDISTGPTFTGTLTYDFTVQDETKDPTRDVVGQYTVIVKDVPSQPQPPAATPGDQKATVMWQQPQTNNSPIVSYTVYTNGTNGQTVSASTTQLTVGGLTNGSNYSFTVVATNGVGNSVASGASNTVTPFGIPGTPTSPTLTASGDGSGQLTMSWGAANNNGSPVTYNVVVVDASAHTSQQFTGIKSLSYSTTGVVGDSYTFTVSATNAAGTGNSASETQPQAPTPGQPASVTLTETAHTATTVTFRCSWTLPPDGNDVGYYDVSFTNAVYPHVTATHVDLNPANKGQTVTCEVRAYSKNGAARSSTASASATI